MIAGFRWLRLVLLVSGAGLSTVASAADPPGPAAGRRQAIDDVAGEMEPIGIVEHRHVDV
jgi:hypothetical protein